MSVRVLEVGDVYEFESDGALSEHFSHFAVPKTSYVEMKRYYESYDPVVAIGDSSRTILFQVGASPFFQNLAQAHFELAVKIVREDGTDMPAPDPAEGGVRGCAPDQSFGTTLIRDVDVKLSNISVNHMSGAHHYEAYFQNLFGFDAESRKSLLEKLLW